MKNTVAYILIGLFIFVYVLLRALNIDITYDEAWSITSFSRLEVIHILNFTPTDANNHIINTLLIKAFRHLFGEATFVSRLPNVIAFAFYLFFSYKIANTFLRPLIGFCLFIALCCNPFLLDFFGLARGYGLALSFMVISIYYLLRFLHTYTFKYAFLSLILANFAVFSNFPLLNYWVALFFIIHFSYLVSREKEKRFYHLLGPNLFILFFLVAVIYEPLRKLVQNDSLYYGGNRSFYADTLQSLTAFSLYDPYNFEKVKNTLPLILGFLGLMAGATWLGKPRSCLRDLILQRKFQLTLLLLIPILSNIVQFYLLDSLYLIDRTALFYYPLIILVFFFYANDIGNPRLLWFSNTYILFICIALVSNQVKNLNLYKTITWDHDSRTREVLSYLQELGHSENKTIHLDSSWPIHSSIQYYLNKNLFNKVKYVKKELDSIADSAHFFLYYDKSLLKVVYNCKDHPIHHYEKDTLLQFPEEGIYLFGAIRDPAKTTHREKKQN